MKIKYEFEPGEMVVEVVEDYFRVLAQPEELREKQGELFTAGNGYTVVAMSHPDYKAGRLIFLRGGYKENDEVHVYIQPSCRGQIIEALKEFGAEVVEPKKDVYVWLNVYTRSSGGLCSGGVSSSKLLADQGSDPDRVGRIKVKLEAGRFDE